MQNDDTKNGEPQTAKKLAPTAANSNANTKAQSTKERARNTKKRKKWSLARHWRDASRKQQFLWMIGGLITAGYLFNYTWGNLQTKWNFQAEHKPTVVNIRPPDFQFFACNPPNIPQSEMITGNINTHIKNIGTATARKVNPFAVQMKLIPEKKTGNKFFDDAPIVTDETCKHPTFTIPGTVFSLDPGIESGIGLRQSAGTMSPTIKTGDTVQFYLLACVYYSEESGVQHGTCDRYRLHIPAKQTLYGVDNLLGTPTIPCDGNYVTGKLQPDIAGHCEE